MNQAVSGILVFLALVVFAGTGYSQANEICSSSGDRPGLADNYGFTPYVFGKIQLSGFDPNIKLPRVTVTYAERGQVEKRLTVEQGGGYCFRRTSAESAGLLIVYLDRVEVARRN